MSALALQPYRLDVHLPRAPVLRRPRRRRAPRAHREPQAAAAEVLLRRRGRRLFEASPASRVLPDPHRGDPRSRGRRGRRAGAHGARRAGLGTPEDRCSSTPWRAAGRPRYVPFDISRGRAPPRRPLADDLPGPATSTGVAGDFERHLDRRAPAGSRPWPSWAARSATSARPRALFLRAGGARPAPGDRPPPRRGPRQGPRRGSRPPTTTRRG